MSVKNCPLCNCISNNEKEFINHKESSKHTVNYLKYFYSKHRKTLLQNKDNVEVKCLEFPIKDLKVYGPPTQPKSTCKFTLRIYNHGSVVEFHRCEFLHAMACRCTVTDERGVSRGTTVVTIPESSPDPYDVIVEVQPDFVGIYMSPLVFQFKRQGSPFYLGVEIVVTCSDDIVYQLEDSAPYVGSWLKDVLPPAKEIVPGVKPPKTDTEEYKVPLPNFVIDHSLRKAITEVQKFFQSAVHVPKEDRIVESLSKDARAIYDFLEESLTKDNYQMYFNLLLNFEEVQMELDIRKYDMQNAVLTRNRKFPKLLFLQVLGLAEKRPSILKGDRLYVRIAQEKLNKEYEGYVHAVQRTEVLLGFGEELLEKYLPNMKFHVRFTYNKMPMQVMIRALTMVKEDHLNHWLFPDINHAAKCTPIINPTKDLVFYNRNIEENPEQATAIKHIVAGSSLPAPYLLHGPPGTGKTVTLVEAIMQLWKLCNHQPVKAFVLVCTPSNSASDIVVEKLLKNIPSCDILRFYSMSRELENIPSIIKEKKCFNFDSQKAKFFVPSMKTLMSYRIIVSTLCNSSRLVSLGIPVGHFTHIFIDESGHAVEPEALAPLVGLLKCRGTEDKSDAFGGQMVLAGDPKQLGPVIRCRVAEEYKLSISMLERLMDLDIYQRISAGDGSTGQFDPRLLTRMRNNYRSHPAILEIPNQLFYDNELRVCADKLQRESLCQLEFLPSETNPVLFHGVIGRDMQEDKNPSYFNPQEVSVVMTYVNKLLSARNGGIRIDPKDIGIITPYRQQVYKIRNQLKKKNLDAICVGSVDELQGQERRAIIISTVRSNPDLMSYDTKYKLGFLKNPKRFNVALTRAKQVLVVIGNPNLLAKDYHWNEFLKYCRALGCYVGATYDSPHDENDDVIQRFSALNLVPVEREPVRISQRANQEDPEWRNDF